VTRHIFVPLFHPSAEVGTTSLLDLESNRVYNIKNNTTLILCVLPGETHMKNANVVIACLVCAGTRIAKERVKKLEKLNIDAITAVIIDGVVQ